MCDYSLYAVASRPAKVGDRLLTTSFERSWTRGFAAVEKPGCAVCLLAGTELAFDNNVQYERALGLFGKGCVRHKVARFRKINERNPNVHHDALEFPDGQIVMLTRLSQGQRATVLQLPASWRNYGRADEKTPERSHQNDDRFRAGQRAAKGERGSDIQGVKG